MGSAADSAKASSTNSVDPDSRGRLIVVSGPSGVGKSSVVEAVLRRFGASFSVSATTREARPGEVEGEDYYFRTRAEFDEMVERGELLEWAEYGGHLYGTPRRELLRRLQQGEAVLLDIENDGARAVKESYPDAQLIFLLPPSMEELQRRLRARGDTSDDDVARRLAVAQEQITQAPEVYTHLVVNEDLETAIDEVTGILDTLQR